MLRGPSRRTSHINSNLLRTEEKLRRRKMFFESLEDRNLMATWTGLGAAGVWLDDANWGGNPGDCA